MKNLVSVFSLVYYACKILLLVWLFQWWMGDVYAQEDMKSIEASREAINVLGDETFEFKATVNCSVSRQGQDNYHGGRAATTYFVCPDGTFSFPQPDSTGYEGWNGYCGETAVSNVSGMLCERFLSPQTVGTYATDITPGTLPATNLRALKKIFTENYTNVRRANPCPVNGSWKARSASDQNFISTVMAAVLQGPGGFTRQRADGTGKEITPTMVLMAHGFSKLHWVTVVDFRRNTDDKFACDVVMNTWGQQKLMTCANFAKYSKTALFGYSILTFER